jgi:hypothetical protein
MALQRVQKGRFIPISHAPHRPALWFHMWFMPFPLRVPLFTLRLLAYHFAGMGPEEKFPFFNFPLANYYGV